MRYGIFAFLILPWILFGEVSVGADVFFSGQGLNLLKGKRVGLITNHTAINRKHITTKELLLQNEKRGSYTVVALFAPEHGISGALHAGEKVQDQLGENIPIYSLHGATRRPTQEMLKGIDLLIYDIQDIGSRSYTFTTTLFYVMEEAAKEGISVVVLDRPNPLGGITVDGPMLEEKWRSFVGYLNVPYCHGMTVGELARFFNQEYLVKCNLTVIPMVGWRRAMAFPETGLSWIPTSPNIPEADTPFYYPTTGIMGELPLVNIGVGYSLPFKLVGAPWIDAETFAECLNRQQAPGVHFYPFHYRPFSGRYEKEDCQGVLIVITNKKTYQPVTTQYLILGLLKSLYPKQFAAALQKSEKSREMFNKVNGTDFVYETLMNEKFVVWKLKTLHEKERQDFLKKRKSYLIPQYGDVSNS